MPSSIALGDRDFIVLGQTAWGDIYAYAATVSRLWQSGWLILKVKIYWSDSWFVPTDKVV